MEKNINAKNMKQQLESGNYTCLVFNNSSVIFKSEKRGVAPLIDFINSEHLPGNYLLADKVIGKAAALLSVKAGFRFIYAHIISTPAKEILSANNIEFLFDEEVNAIQNRNKTGLCPMEGLSAGVNKPDEMYRKVVSWLSSK